MIDDSNRQIAKMCISLNQMLFIITIFTNICHFLWVNIFQEKEIWFITFENNSCEQIIQNLRLTIA